MKNIKYIIAIILFSSHVSFSQHEHHNMNHTTDTMKVIDSTTNDMNKHNHNHNDTDTKTDTNKKMNKDMNNEMKNDMNMSHSYSLSLPMNRNGSGTGWLPDESPMNGYMLHSNKWMCGTTVGIAEGSVRLAP
jgi:hypothetical protein